MTNPQRCWPAIWVAEAQEDAAKAISGELLYLERAVERRYIGNIKGVTHAIVIVNERAVPVRVPFDAIQAEETKP